MRCLFAGVSIVATLALTGCGSSGPEMVWCVAEDEEVTEEFKQEYPDLYMSKAACEAFERAAGDG